jgi:hypothetical protein
MEADFHSKQESHYQAFVTKSDLSLESLIHQMETLSDSEMTKEDFQHLGPFTDEIMLYFQDLIKTPEDKEIVMASLTAQNIFKMVNFAYAFDLGDNEFWSLVTSALAQGNRVTTLRISEALGLLNNLKEVG